MATIYERYMRCGRCGKSERQTATLPLNSIGEEMADNFEHGFGFHAGGHHRNAIFYTDWRDLDEIIAGRRLES